MYPYILIFFYLISIFIFNNYIDNNQNKLLSIIFSSSTGFLILFLFAALRGNGNGDYFTYLDAVKSVKSLTYIVEFANERFEIGFIALAYLTNSLHLPAQFVLIFMNFISFSCVYYFVKKHSKNISLSLLLFFSFVLLFDMHHSRSAIAMSAGLVFFDALREKKYVKSLLFFLLAFSFHRSALVLLILMPIALYPNWYPCLDKIFCFSKRYFIIILGLLILFHFYTPINLFTFFLNNPLTMTLAEKIERYLINDRWSYPFKLYDPRFLLLIYLFYYGMHKRIKDSQLLTTLMVILLIAIFSIVIFSTSTILTMRIYNFYNLFTIVLIANLYKMENITLVKNNFIAKAESLLINHSDYLILFAYLIYSFALIFKQVDYYFFF